MDENARFCASVRTVVKATANDPAQHAVIVMDRRRPSFGIRTRKPLRIGPNIPTIELIV